MKNSNIIITALKEQKEKMKKIEGMSKAITQKKTQQQEILKKIYNLYQEIFKNFMPYRLDEFLTKDDKDKRYSSKIFLNINGFYLSNYYQSLSYQVNQYEFLGTIKFLKKKKGEVISIINSSEIQNKSQKIQLVNDFLDLFEDIKEIEDDKAYTHELASPVRDRALEVTLKPPTVEEWSNWALSNGVDKRIIGFLNWKPSYLHKVDFEDRQKFTTPRGWARVSQMIKGVDKYDTIELLSQSCISEGIAIEFVAFCRIEDKLNLNEILKNPEKLKDFNKDEDIGIKYFIISSIGERYKEEKSLNLEKVMDICNVLDKMKHAEFVALLLRMCYKYNPSKFKKEFPLVASKSNLINKYFDLMTD